MEDQKREKKQTNKKNNHRGGGNFGCKCEEKRGEKKQG